MSKSLKAIAALLIFVAIYFLVSSLIFSVVYYTLGAPTNWRLFTVGAFANAWAAGFGVSAGRGLLDKFLAPYPARFVGIAFIALLGLWFVPLTLIYASGAIAILFGGADMGDWPPEGELGEYFLYQRPEPLTHF
jgi:hypothetical protein